MSDHSGLSGLEPSRLPPAELHMSIYNRDGVMHIEIDEYLLTGQFDESEFRKRVDDHLTSVQRPLIVINLAKVESISSRLLGELLAINREVERREGQMRLAQLAPLVREVFAATRLDRKIQVCDSVAEAIESFQA